MSFLTLCQDAAREIGITPPDTIISSTEANAIALRGIAQRVGRAIARRATWQKITKQTTFATVASTVAYDLASDFDWYFPETMFNRTSKREVIGPVSEREW